MELKHVVEIDCNGGYGSGYRVAPGVVLTARHVLVDKFGKAPPLGAAARFRPLGEDPARRPPWQDATLAWVGDEKLDIAVLCTVSAVSGVPQFGALPSGAQELKCMAVGFPLATSGATEEPYQLSGTIHTATFWLSGEIAVDVDSRPPENPDGWPGISGASLFAGDHIVGVIKSYPRAFGGGMLKATPLAGVGNDPSFCAALGQSCPLLLQTVSVAPDTQAPPRQARSPTQAFCGRDKELAELRAKLTAAAAVRSVVVCGMGGIGKTALISAAAADARVAARFPQGTLWVDVKDTDVMAALESIASAFGEDVSRLDTVSARAGHVRSLLRNRKILLCLDDVWEEQEVTPLLSTLSDGSAALVTTRDHELAELVGDEVISLERLDEAAALELIGRIVGDDAVQADLEAWTELSRLLGGLPLALELGARRARLELRKGRASAREFVATLAEDSRRLDLGLSDRQVRATFNASFERSLDVKQQCLYRLLGVLRPHELLLGAIAALWELEERDASMQLASLEDLSLLERGGPEQFRIHPLLHDFARERLAEMESDAVAAGHRILADYFHAAAQRAGNEMQQVSDLAAVLSSHYHAARTGERERAERVYPTFNDLGIAGFLSERGAAISLAECEENQLLLSGDDYERAYRSFETGEAWLHAHRYPRAVEHLERARDLYATLSFKFDNQRLFEASRRAQAALDDGRVTPGLRRAFELHNEDLSSKVVVSPSDGDGRWILSDPQREKTYEIAGEGDALVVHGQRDNDRGRLYYLKKSTWSLGQALRGAGELERAVEQFEASLALERELRAGGMSGDDSLTLSQIGDCYKAMGERDRAREYFEQAVSAATGGRTRDLTDEGRAVVRLAEFELDAESLDVPAVVRIVELLDRAAELIDPELSKQIADKIGRVSYLTGPTSVQYLRRIGTAFTDLALMGVPLAGSAVRWLERTMTLAREYRNPATLYDEAQALFVLGRLFDNLPSPPEVDPSYIRTTPVSRERRLDATLACYLLCDRIVVSMEDPPRGIDVAAAMAEFADSLPADLYRSMLDSVQADPHAHLQRAIESVLAASAPEDEADEPAIPRDSMDAAAAVRGFFTKDLPERLQAHPDLVRELEGVYKFVVEGVAGGTWLVDLSRPEALVSEADGDAECTVTADARNLLAVLIGETDLQKAFMNGRIQIAGEFSLALKLGELLRVS